MKRTNIKEKQYSIMVVLVMISFMLAGMIYSASQRKEDHKQLATEEVSIQEVVIEDIELTEYEAGEPETIVEVEEIPIEGNEILEEVTIFVEVEPISIVDDQTYDTGLVVMEEIEVPKAEEPEKPDLTPPVQEPETSDDLNNLAAVPEYAEEAITYIPDAELVVEKVEEVRGSNLIPDSDNPFLQVDIPSNGDGGELMGSDLGDGTWGTGDKF